MNSTGVWRTLYSCGENQSRSLELGLLWQRLDEKLFFYESVLLGSAVNGFTVLILLQLYTLFWSQDVQKKTDFPAAPCLFVSAEESPNGADKCLPSQIYSQQFPVFHVCFVGFGDNKTDMHTSSDCLFRSIGCS